MSQHEVLGILRELGGVASISQITARSKLRGITLARTTIQRQLRRLEHWGTVHHTGRATAARWHLGGPR